MRRGAAGSACWTTGASSASPARPGPMARSGPCSWRPSSRAWAPARPCCAWPRTGCSRKAMCASSWAPASTPGPTASTSPRAGRGARWRMVRWKSATPCSGPTPRPEPARSCALRISRAISRICKALRLPAQSLISNLCLAASQGWPPKPHEAAPSHRSRPGLVDAPAGSPCGRTGRQRGLAASRRRCRHRTCLRPGPQREEAGAALLGRQVVPALQPAQGHAVQPSGLHRAVARLRGRAHRRRPARRPEAGQPLQGARLPDHDPVQPRGQRDHPPARRGRCAPGAEGAAARPGRRQARQDRAGRGQGRQEAQRQ
eukprot:Opistho-1_new@19258